MLRPTVTSMLSAAALIALSGCSITVNSGGSEPARSSASPSRSQSTAKKPTRNIRLNRRPAGSGTSSTGTSTGSTVDLTRPITSPIAFGNGTGGAFKGHAYVIPENTTKMPDLGGMIPFATLYTDTFNVASQRFEGGFPGALVQEDWFGIRYEGRFNVAKDGEVEFKVVSDDGTILYIDGQKVVENDGKHTAKSATGKKELKAGAHTLRLDYFQAEKGSVALQVYVMDGRRQTLLTGTK